MIMTPQDNNKLLAKQKKIWRRPRRKRLGLIETFLMWRRGIRDGKRGLPMRQEDGTWDSPNLQKEADGYNEFCMIRWERTQRGLAEEFALQGRLIDAIEESEAQLEKWKSMEPPKPASDYLSQRKGAEHKLTEAQVRARRENENKRRNAYYYSRLDSLKKELVQMYVNLSTINNFIIETNNGTRMICERMKFRIQKRRDVYWGAALVNHPEKQEMPATPQTLCTSETEIAYLAQHKILEEEATRMYARKRNLLSQLDND